MQRASDANARGIAKLKIDASYQSVALQTKISEAEFNMVHKINTIINDANNKKLENEKTFVEKVNTINNNILLTKKEKDDAISKAQADYANNRIKIQDNMGAAIRTSNTEIQKQLEKAKSSLDAAKTE